VAERTHEMKCTAKSTTVNSRKKRAGKSPCSTERPLALPLLGSGVDWGFVTPLMSPESNTFFSNGPQ
jgi:hypothetical protein